MQTARPGITRSDSSLSETSSASTSSASSRNSMKEKIENRRSILNQLNDGKIRRTDGAGNQKDVILATRERRKLSIDEKQDDYEGKNRGDLERFKVLMSNKVEARKAAPMSPSPIENLQRLKEETSRSMSRSRQRKEAAELKLKGLFSAHTQSYSPSPSRQAQSYSPGPNRFGSPALLNVKSSGSDDSSRSSRENHYPPKVSRNLFDPNLAPTNDENNVICPSPRRATREGGNVLTEMGNLSISGEKSIQREESAEENNDVKDHFSQQMNIQVLDNFFVFKL